MSLNGGKKVEWGMLREKIKNPSVPDEAIIRLLSPFKRLNGRSKNLDFVLATLQDKRPAVHTRLKNMWSF